MSSQEKLLGVGFLLLISCVAVVISLYAGNFKKQDGKIAEAVQKGGSVNESAGIINSLPANVHDREGRLISEAELQRSREYNIGRALGACLVQDCAAVFVGTINTVGEPEKGAGELVDFPVTYRKVDLTIEQWVWGDRKEFGQNVQLRHAEPTVTKSSGGPWRVWSGVEVRVGVKLLVALWGANAQRLKWIDGPEKIALVAVSDDALTTKVRESLNLHTRLTESPDQIKHVPKLLKDKPDDVLSGYVVSYLIGAEVKRNVDHTALILSSLLQLRTLPEGAQDDIAKEIGSDFYRLSPDTRRKVAESLIAAAAGDDLKRAGTAISALVWITDSKLLDVRPLLNTAQRRKLIANYQRALKKGMVERGHVPFESQLGLRRLP